METHRRRPRARAAPGEADDVGDVRVHVVGHDQIGRPVLGRTAAPVSGSRKAVRVAMPLSLAAWPTLAEGSMPRQRTPRPPRAAAGTRRCWPPRRRSPARTGPRPRVHELPGVLHPGGGEGGEVRVLRERLLRLDQRRYLGEPAARADPQVQRVGELGLVEPLPSEEQFAGRRGTEVDHAHQFARAAEPADGHRPRPLPRCNQRAMVPSRCVRFSTNYRWLAPREPRPPSRTPTTAPPGCAPGPRRA